MIKFQSLPRQKKQAIREEVLRQYAETAMSYSEIAEVNGVQVRTVEYIVRNFAQELPNTPLMRKKNMRKRKNFLSTTPRRLALKSLILALNDSAIALEALLL